MNFPVSYHSHCVVFFTGEKPIPSKGTHVEIVLSHKDVPNEWGAFIKSKSDNSLKVTITTPASIPVGKWMLKIDVVKSEDNNVNVFRYEHKDPVYILFNPWCQRK